jgi:hypothetical protein
MVTLKILPNFMRSVIKWSNITESDISSNPRKKRHEITTNFRNNLATVN